MPDEDPASAVDGGVGSDDDAAGAPIDDRRARSTTRRTFAIIWIGVALAVAIPVLRFVVNRSEVAEYVAPPGAVEDVAVIGDEVLVLPTEPTAPLDAVAVVESFDERVGAITTAVARLDGPAPRWLGPRLTDGAPHPLVLVGDLVVTVDDGALRALSLDDGLGVLGVDAWRVALPAPLPSPCEHCVVAAGEHVVVRTDDGGIVAVDGATGRPAWDRPATSDVVAVHAAGDDVVVVDGTGAVELVASADGTTRRVVAPDCPPSAAPPAGAAEGAAEHAATTATVVVLDDQRVVVRHGPGPGCWRMVPTSSDLPTWTTAMPPTTRTADGAVAHDGTTLVVDDGGGGLVVIDLATGASTYLSTSADARQVPIAVTPMGIVTAAVDADGAWSVAVVDPSSGAVGWRHPLDGGVPVLDGGTIPEAVAAGTRPVAIGVDADVVHLVALAEGGDGLELVDLELGTGAAGSPAAVELPPSDGDTRFAPLAWRPGDVVVLVDDRIAVIDLEDGRLLDRTGA